MSEQDDTNTIIPVL